MIFFDGHINAGSLVHSVSFQDIVSVDEIENFVDLPMVQSSDSCKKVMTLLHPSNTLTSSSRSVGSTLSEPFGTSPTVDESIYVRGRGSSTSPPETTSPPTSPSAVPKKISGTVDINGIRISIDTPSARYSEKDAKNQVSIDI